MKARLLLKLVGIMSCCLVVTAHAATVWDEANHGDLSNNGLAPTPVVVTTGNNVVIGTTGNAGQGIDRDYFRITVPVGTTLTALKLLSNTSVSGGASFIGIQAGPQLTATGAAELLGYTHYGNDLIDTDLLPNLVYAYTGSLPSGTYSVWVQETGGPATYGFDFVITPASPEAMADAPLPSWAYAILAALLIGAALKQTRRV